MSWCVQAVVVHEGNSGTKPIRLKITLSMPAASAVRLSWQTADGTAFAGSALRRRLGLAGDRTRLQHRLRVREILGDRVVEPDETFSVHLSSPIGTQLGKATATATVTMGYDDGGRC